MLDGNSSCRLRAGSQLDDLRLNLLWLWLWLNVVDSHDLLVATMLTLNIATTAHDGVIARHGLLNGCCLSCWLIQLAVWVVAAVLTMRGSSR